MSVGPAPPRFVSVPRKIYMSSLPTWLLMFRQYEYPTYQKQSAPPSQSLALVSRTASVLYGGGNVNFPFAPLAGRNAWICDAVNRALSAGEPASRARFTADR